MHFSATLLPSILLAAGAVAQSLAPRFPLAYRATNGTNSTTTPSSTNSSNAAISDPAYWYADITHQGVAAFNADSSSYVVFRNVKDYGAAGDGSTDDTAAIQAAIEDGDRCAPGSCESSTTTPAVVYFPAGTYIISSAIIDYYYTQIIGNPNSLPTIKASSSFSGSYLIDADPYQSDGDQAYPSTDVFYRQIRNIILDTTSIAASTSVSAIHWPTSQATSLQNVQINLSQAGGTQHVGVFVENGSAGLIVDVTIYGGLIGFNIGNQQYTVRNVTVYNAVTAIYQLWSWGFLYKSLTVSNCTKGVDMSAGGSSDQLVGSLAIIDSTFEDTPVAVITAYSTSQTDTNGSLILENVVLTDVPVAVQGPSSTTVLAGGSTTITAWGQGHEYTPTGPTEFQGTYTPSRPSVLLSGDKYYEMSKPQFQTVSSSDVLSARSYGAKGDGTTDDTSALQSVITAGAADSKLVFIDAGTYLVTSTIHIPPGSQIVGESYSVIMSSGDTWSDMSTPIPVVQVGTSGESGSVQWTDMIVSTQGSQPGAVLIEWNLDASSGSGMWDVHTRIGGFTGSDLQVAQCPTTTAVSSACEAAYMSMHVTTTGTGVYLENVWLWTADHDLDDASSTQISIYTGRGLYFESSVGTAWFYATAVEHHSLYQFQLANTKNMVMGFIQTETPYYQPDPNAINSPYPENSTLNDPDFSQCSTVSGNCDAWGMRILSTEDISIYGAGFYSFFDDYSTTCSDGGGPEDCQSMIFDIEDSSSIDVYCLNTVGTTNMIVVDGTVDATYSSNVNVYPDTIALFHSG